MVNISAFTTVRSIMLQWTSLGCSFAAVPFFQVFKLVSTETYTWSMVPLKAAITTNPLHIRILNS